MNKLTGKNVILMVLIAISILCASFATCYAREGKQWRLMDAHRSSEPSIERKGHHYSKHHGKHKKPPPPGKIPPPPEPVPEPAPAPEPPSPSPPPPTHVPVPPPSPSHKNSTTFNVLDFGAKGDGESDDTKAFLSAWSATCKVQASTLIVPSDLVFLIKPVSFLGPCEPGITFQLDGTIIAPTSSSAWGEGLSSWIGFKKLSKITVEGMGMIDGRGSVWYNGLIASDGEEKSKAPSAETSINSPNNIDSTNLSKMPKMKPTALRFYGSDDVTVAGITIQNSPQTHLKFDSCTNVLVFDFSASSPGDSPNTDGIHLQNSQNVRIRSSNLACGDDCVSIQTGCSNIDIQDVNCGPGHGFSIGGLGKGNTKACVFDVNVHDCTISNTMTGVRIKTWQV